MSANAPLGEQERTALKRVAGLGILCFAASYYGSPARAWANLLLGNFYFVSLSLAAACFIAIQYLTNSSWSVVFRRVPESMIAYLPVGAGVSAFLLLGAPRLYPWARAAAGDPLIQAKASYLNLPAFALRAALYFAAWWLLTRALVANSRAQDDSGAPAHSERNRLLSALYLVVFAVTFSMAAIDWTMSLEPRWYSTIYPWYVFSGAFLSCLAAMALLLAALIRKGRLKEIHSPHLHDLGKYLFAFSVFWAYLWFSQYLLIWYSNIPEETTFYVRRLTPGWKELFILNLLLNFVAPFFLLLKIRQKKRINSLMLAGATLAVGHWLDLYILVMPTAGGAHALPSPLDLGIFLGFCAAFLLCFDRSFAQASPVPLRDPLLRQKHLHA